jgi:hypothetical protein
MYDLSAALISLRPGSAWKLSGDDYSGLEWLDSGSTPPSRDECNAEMARLRKIYDDQQYSRDRKSAYPSIVDQLDTLYHQGYDGWYAMISDVKNRYPKPE